MIISSQSRSFFKNLSPSFSGVSQLCHLFSNLDSKWIYSTKHEESQFRHPGRVSIYNHVGNDTHNASMRFVEHLDRCSMIVTNSRVKVEEFMRSLIKKERFSNGNGEKTGNLDGSELSVSLQNTSLAIIEKELDLKSLQFETEIEISKLIELDKQTNKSQSQNKHLLSQAKHLKQYMKTRFFQKHLKQLKDRQGFAPIFQFNEVFGQIQSLQKEGFDIVFAFCENQNSIKDCGNLVKLLETKQIRYQILPTSGGIIQAIVSSGLPADRFAIEIYSNNFSQILSRRSSMKITICWQIITSKLMDLCQAVEKIMGKQQIVYVHVSSKQFFRGQIFSAIEYLEKHQITENVSYLVIGPRIADFNEGVKSELNIRSHIKGELQSDQINMIEMEILVKKLKEIDRKEQKYEIDAWMVAGELLAKIQNQTTVKECLKKMFRRRDDEWIENVMREGRKFVVVDHLGLNRKQEEI